MDNILLKCKSKKKVRNTPHLCVKLLRKKLSASSLIRLFIKMFPAMKKVKSQFIRFNEEFTMRNDSAHERRSLILHSSPKAHLH